ncbi:MAG: hypothetical protein WC676_02230 [Candidatus Omnitrophota bacterium]
MSSTGKILQSEADNTKELVKSISFLAGEVSVFKEALSKNVSNLDETLKKTNQSTEELRDAVVSSTDKIITSGEKLAVAQNFHSKTMLFLTFALVVVGIFQILVMNGQSNIMKSQSEIMKHQADHAKKITEIELRPMLEIQPYAATYSENNLVFHYFLSNSGKSNILNIKRCHTFELINRITNEESSIKPETCVSNEHDLTLLHDRSSLIHDDMIGDYKLDELDPHKYYRINLKVSYATEEFLGKKCVASRKFDLLPIDNKFVIRPLAYLDTVCE